MTAAPTDVFINLYEMLGVAPTADSKAIEERIKEETRTWRKRTGSPDLSKRQEAELRMQHLSTARDTLLDAGKRSAYDQRLDRQGTEAPRRTTPTGDRNWVALAEEYLAQNDYSSAAYAAREATQVEGNSPRAWNLRGRANAGLGNHNDALYEVRQAAEIEPNNPQYQFDMGTVCEQMERWKDALTAYETASRLDPSDHIYRLSIAGVYVQNDMPEKGLPIVEEVHRRLPDDELVNNVLAETLSAAAEQVPAHREDGGFYMITSAEEVEKMEALIVRARGLKHLDPEVIEQLDQVTRYVDRCKKNVYSPPSIFGQYGIVVAPFVLFMSSLLALGGLVATFEGFGGVNLGLFVVAGLVAFLTFRSTWIPGWKRNKRSLRR